MAVTAAQIKKVVKVAGGIIFSQEGDYGSVNKNDNNHGMSVGKCQWNAYWGRALPLLQEIVKADEAGAKNILGESLYNEIAGNGADAWNNQSRAATDEEAKAISALLSTKQGKKVQDATADADITAYIKNGVKVGVLSLKALAYYADLENQGGAGASKRIAQTAGNDIGGVEKVGLEEIHAYALKDSVMGQYASRRKKVYEAVRASDLSDLESAGNKKDGQGQKTVQNAPQEATRALDKGDTVTFTGGEVYKSSTATQAAKSINQTSTCKITAVNKKGTRPYHLISQDGRGVYGWVNTDSIKELSTTAQKDPKTVSKGDTVTFTGGAVYKSSTAAQAAVQRNVISTCTVTAVNADGKHPYHCVSKDGRGVYGWVDKEDVK